jgi:hypothetical protein
MELVLVVCGRQQLGLWSPATWSVVVSNLALEGGCSLLAGLLF